MASIRPFQRADLVAVANLLRGHLHNWSLDERVLAAMVLDHPWSDEELPSLVAEDESGEVVGFIGAQVRRMCFEGHPIRGVCCTQLVVSPDHRAGAPGALLLGRLLAGPQDVTWSDSSTDPVLRLWQRFGGHLDYVRAADFMLVMRQLRWMGSILATRARRRPVGRRQMPVGSFPVPVVGKWITGRAPTVRAARVEGEDASAATIVEHLPAISRRTRLRVDWDAAALEHLCAQVEGVEGGLVLRLVRRGEKPIGWYAYLLRPGGVSRLLHLAAVDRCADLVLEDLVQHASAGGSAVLAGRAEPHLEWPLRHRHAALGLARQPIIHARDPALAAALGTGSSLLTRLAGEVFAA